MCSVEEALEYQATWGAFAIHSKVLWMFSVGAWSTHLMRAFSAGPQRVRSRRSAQTEDLIR